MFNWTRSETIALSLNSCAICYGSGLILTRNGSRPCACVTRAIFRICWERFQYCGTHYHRSRVDLEPGSGRRRPSNHSRKQEEFLADFIIITRRTLTPEELRLFRFHFLLGADWKACCPRLHLDRGNFFHAVYRVEAKLGLAFRETEPYPLFPLDDYFYGEARGVEWRINRPKPNVAPAIPESLRFPDPSSNTLAGPPAARH